MRFAVLIAVASCQQMPPAPPPPPAAPATTAAVECLSDERQWGTTCCHSEGEPGFHHWTSCRGPQLGKVCHRRGDCDIDCECDRALVHHDGETGVTGHCEGPPPSGQWTCEVDEAGKVTSLIID
jgi:hypothetical protein